MAKYCAANALNVYDYETFTNRYLHEYTIYFVEMDTKLGYLIYF